jgi:hypothetical protein
VYHEIPSRQAAFPGNSQHAPPSPNDRKTPPGHAGFSVPKLCGFARTATSAGYFASCAGKPGHIVSPCVVEVVIQEDGREQAEFERRAGSEPLDDLPGAQVFLVRVRPHEMEVELIGVHLGKEFG